MLKNKIARKLSLYFAFALLVFSIIIGGVFMFLFRHHNVEVHKLELAARAESIAATLAGFIDRGSGMMGAGGYGPYLHLLGYIAGTDVWIVDRNLNLIMGGTMPDEGGAYQYADLPENANKLVSEVFTDKTVFSENFSGLLSEATLTVGTPIRLQSGDIMGVVLLHSSIRTINRGLFNGFGMLIMSIAAALCAAILLSVRFSLKFTGPMNRIHTTAMLLADGDYTAKNNIKQNDEIGQLAATIDILAERLHEASRESAKLEQMRKDFVANISHELRTPITVIRGSLEALTDKVVTAPLQVETYHRKMLAETVFLQRLVGDLLDLSRLQNPDFAIEKNDISLSDVINDVIGSAAHIAKDKGVNVVVSNDDTERAVYADYGRIRQMFLIVLDNAVKFSPEGGRVDVTLAGKTVSICDYGAGISGGDLPYIFDRFYKARQEHNKTGTGLGLAIAKQIAERHGVTLTAQSEEGKGARFIFGFP
jgi:signal transduction histidine kinase